MRDDEFHLLYVCAGNAERSPSAELITRRAIDGSARQDADRLLVSSAGVRARPIDRMNAAMRTALAEIGIAGGDRVPRRLDATMLADADLVLTMQTRLRDMIIAEHSDVAGLAERLFTLPEFARLITTATDEPEPADDRALPDRARRLRDLAAARRAAAPMSETPGADDIADPWGGTLDDHRACLALINRQLEAFLPALLDLPGAGLPASVD